MGEETKLVCADCFVKQDAKDVVTQDGVIGKCDYCGQENVKVMSCSDFVEALYRKHYEKEMVLKEQYRKNGVLEMKKGGPFSDNQREWGELSELDNFDNMADYIETLTNKKNLHEDLINSWNNKNKEIYG